MNCGAWVLGGEVAIIVNLLVYSGITGISPVPTTPRVRKAMVSVAPEKVTGSILELGAGWGSLAFVFAKKYPSCTVYAYELSPVPWLFLRLRYLLTPLPNLVISRANFYKVSFRGAGLILCYLFPGGMGRLQSKFEKELSPEAFVISNTFEVPGWTPEVVVRADDQFESPVFRYRIPVAVPENDQTVRQESSTTIS